MELGRTLKLMRVSQGFSQEELAERTYISRSTISKIESGRMKIYADDLMRWCKETGNQEIFIALLCGVDPAMVQQIMDTISSTPIVGTIIKWGGYIGCVINF